MNPKRKKAMVVFIIIFAATAPLVIAFATGALHISFVFRDPLNMVLVLLTCIAVAVALAAILLLLMQRSKACQNTACSSHPQYIEAADDTYKEMTGVLDMAKVFAEQEAEDLAERENNAEGIGAGIDRMAGSYNEAAHKMVADAPAQTEDYQLDSILADFASVDTAFNIPKQNFFQNVASAVSSNLKAITTNISNFADYEPEEPKVKASMDFTDDMIPLIVSALQRARLDSALRNSRQARTQAPLSMGYMPASSVDFYDHPAVENISDYRSGNPRNNTSRVAGLKRRVG